MLAIAEKIILILISELGVPAIVAILNKNAPDELAIELRAIRIAADAEAKEILKS